jgi:Raf kinase inhibitor-like YbhB/YbcL family protein
MKIHSNSFIHRGPIPAEVAFGRRGDAGEPCVLSANRNPHLAWDAVPEGTASFALLCIDPDAPTRPDDVNQPGRTVPADLPRAEFVHWVMIDLPADLREIAAGALSDGITVRGKPAAAGPGGARQGVNDYTGWFAGDADMAGHYHGYDGPCPPFNDAIPHRYFFRLFALDVEKLDLPDGFTAGQVLNAIQGHVLAEALVYGTYSLNPEVA